MDIEKFKNKSLEALLEPLNKGERDYIELRIQGLGIKESLKIANRKRDTLLVWRNENPDLVALEKYLVENRESYIEEANKLYFTGLNSKAKKALEKQIDNALNWDSLSPVDKPYAYRALELFVKLSADSHNIKMGYEEHLKKLKEGE